MIKTSDYDVLASDSDQTIYLELVFDETTDFESDIDVFDVWFWRNQLILNLILIMWTSDFDVT